MGKLGMTSIFVLASALAGFSLAALAEVGPPYPEPTHLWFTLLPQSPIQDFSQYEHAVKVFIPKALVGQPVEPFWFEFTGERDGQAVATIPFTPFTNLTTYPNGLSTSPFRFYEIPPALKALPDGSYSVAIMVEGRRCSNDAKFVLDRAAVLTALPVLELIPLDPPPFYSLPLLGVRANGTTPLAFNLLSFCDIVETGLIVDGVKRRPFMMVGAGPNPLLESGDRWTVILDISGNYVPPIEPGKPHHIELRVNLDRYVATPIDLPAYP